MEMDFLAGTALAGAVMLVAFVCGVLWASWRGK